LTSDQDSLHAVVLRLAPKAEAMIPAGLGHRVHAAFLKMIEQVDTALAEELHASGRRLGRNAVLSGLSHRLIDGIMLPVGMRFGVEKLTETEWKYGTTRGGCRG